MASAADYTAAFTAMCTEFHAAALKAYIGCRFTVLLPDGRQEIATLHAVSTDGAGLESGNGDLMLVDLHEIEAQHQ